MNADIQDIQPQKKYTSADLNWNDSNSRVSQEHNNRNNSSSEFYRPQIIKTIDNLDTYDILFLGYPIWWGEAPNIVYTFLEECSEQFVEKIIIPFCTSSSSSIGESAINLQPLVDQSAIWYSGQRLTSSANSSTIEKWIDDLRL